MSVYPAPNKLHTRQASTSSVASSYTSNYFPDSRSTTVTSGSSSSSRFTHKSTKSGPNINIPTDAAMSRTVASPYLGNYVPETPPLRPSISQSSPPSGHSLTENGRVTSPGHFKFPDSPLSTPLSTSPTKVEGNPNRRSIIRATTTIPTDLKAMRHSSVSHLRTLSQISNGAAEEFKAVVSEEVHGMHGRKRLQRANTHELSSWERMNWMDKRRQYIQAYEYLCHIGEAKEWMEECIGEPIPPIVELEEALRDGVTLAKLVRVFVPELVPRIFEAKKLQYRHYDNISRFLQFVKKVELPEIFLFEFTDLYSKKNIPKVIYCIHALSFLLYRLGMTGAVIGNLVGKLEFTEEEIQNTQKGLDQAGVTLPSFRGVNKHFEPELELEPQETEEERIERELGEAEEATADLQQYARGALLRMRLMHMMEALWDVEPEIIALQAHVRGVFSRAAFAYRYDMANWAKDMQAAARGYLLRKSIEMRMRKYTAMERLVVRLQARSRGLQLRNTVKSQAQDLAKNILHVTKLQATVRGALLRRSLNQQVEAVQKNRGAILQLQAATRGMLLRRRLGQDFDVLAQEEEDTTLQTLQARIRGALVRKSLRKDDEHLKSADNAAAVEGVQAAARGLLVRQAFNKLRRDLKRADDRMLIQLQAFARGSILRSILNADKGALEADTATWSALQAIARGVLMRLEHKRKMGVLRQFVPKLVELQAAARGVLARDEYDDKQGLLKEAEEEIVAVQAYSRGMLLRNDYQGKLKTLKAEEDNIKIIQAFCRGILFRMDLTDFLEELEENAQTITLLQAHCRGVILRERVDRILRALEDEEQSITVAQAIAKGWLERKRFSDKLKYFNENMDRVIKIQSFVRAKQQGEAYRSLTSGKNPPVGTIKNFVHLLNDSDFDFDEEVEFERLRKNVVQHVRANELAETYIDQLDIKIALLVKNKITLDEVIKHQKRFSGHVGTLLSNAELTSADPFDLKALNKNSRRKLELYQMLFFALQTQPLYLARLFKHIREQGIPDKEQRRIEGNMMCLFGYAQKRREEYHLLKLISRSIKEEVDKFEQPQEYLRGNFFWAKVLGAYLRSPRDRKFLIDLLQPLIKKNVIENLDLDLESDPMQIYRSAVNNEELRTGKRSSRKPKIGREEAIRDPETRKMFIAHLQDLRDLSDNFIDAFEDNLNRMPYGIRYIAQQSFEILCEKFPSESRESILQIVEHFVYTKYLNPAVVSPDTMGIVDKTLSPMQKKNLGELSKLLNQLSLGKLFAHDNVYLQPLNEYVSVAVRRLHELFVTVVEVKDAESHFRIDEFDDLTARQKPTLYMKMVEILALHRLVAQEIDCIAPLKDDPLRDIIKELGSAKNSEDELRTVQNQEITLYLNPAFQAVEDPESEIKALMVETKRCILYIIRIQTGPNLMEILVKPVQVGDEEKWKLLLQDELSGKKRGAYSELNTLSDLSTLSYAELKRTALENIIQLEKMGKITRKNFYQDILNAIATDIRTKHRRRVQRQKELEGVKQTLAHLTEKSNYLDSQVQIYNDYIEQAMVTLQNKKGKKRFLLPFTRQYFHMKELQRSGKIPKFGSYKYSAQALAEKGVLVEMEGYGEKQLDRVNFTISSDEVGVFYLEASYGAIQIPGASGEVSLDDLLQAQFNNNQFMMIFEGTVKLNVNLFLHLIFKKFYRDA